MDSVCHFILMLRTKKIQKNAAKKITIMALFSKIKIMLFCLPTGQVGYFAEE